jgi:hypothetical protein
VNGTLLMLINHLELPQSVVVVTYIVTVAILERLILIALRIVLVVATESVMAATPLEIVT